MSLFCAKSSPSYSPSGTRKEKGLVFLEDEISGSTDVYVYVYVHVYGCSSSIASRVRHATPPDPYTYT